MKTAILRQLAMLVICIAPFLVLVAIGTIWDLTLLRRWNVFVAVCFCLYLLVSTLLLTQVSWRGKEEFMMVSGICLIWWQTGLWYGAFAAVVSLLDVFVGLPTWLRAVWLVPLFGGFFGIRGAFRGFEELPLYQLLPGHPARMTLYLLSGVGMAIVAGWQLSPLLVRSF